MSRIVIITPPPPPPTEGGRASSLSIAEHLRAAADQLDAEMNGKAKEGYKVFLAQRVGGIE